MPTAVESVLGLAESMLTQLASKDVPGRRESLLSSELDTRAADLIRSLERPFDAQNPDHLEAARRLWNTAWPNIPCPGLIHGGWTKLGFHSGDLAKELQCGGISLVHHLLNFATLLPTRYNSAMEIEFPLAPSSLAVCLLVRGFLRLHAPGTVPQPVGGCGRLASDETLRRFLSWAESRRAPSTTGLQPFQLNAYTLTSARATATMPSTRCTSSFSCTCSQLGSKRMRR